MTYRSDKPSEFDPLHEDVRDVDVVKQSVGVEERPTLVSLDVDLYHGLTEVDDLQQVVHDDRRHVGRARVVSVTRDLPRLPAHVGTALVVGRHAHLERASDVGHRVLDDNDLRPTAQIPLLWCLRPIRLTSVPTLCFGAQTRLLMTVASLGFQYRGGGEAHRGAGVTAPFLPLLSPK